MRIEDALQQFVVQLEADGRSQHTDGQYRRHVKAFAEWAEGAGRAGQVDRIDHEDVACFPSSAAARAWPDGRSKKATSANALRSSLKCFFAFLHRAGYAERNAGRLIKRAITSPGPPKTPTPEEQEQLLNTLRADEGFEAERDHVLFHLMLSRGIRVGSVVILNVEDVDLAAGEVTLRCKGDRTERIFLGKAIAEHLRKWIGERASGPRLATKDGRRITSRKVARRCSKWVEKAEIRRAASPHSLQHVRHGALRANERHLARGGGAPAPERREHAGLRECGREET